nr:hypothetical protein [uncultured Mucilaginibacter sp.]
MKVDNPNAFRFIMQDELYLLPVDKVAKPIPAAAEEPVAMPAEVAVIAAPAVVAEPEPSQPIKTAEPVFNYLGSNNKRFLILVNYPDDEFIASAHLAALENILKRKELVLNDVAIFNTIKYAPVTMAKLKEAFKPEKLLVLGKGALPADLGNLTLNKPVLAGGKGMLYSFSFGEMMDSNEMKKVFWEQMKTL